MSWIERVEQIREFGRTPDAAEHLKLVRWNDTLKRFDYIEAPPLAGQDLSLKTLSKSVLIERPTANEDLALYITERALTLTEIHCLIFGTNPSLTIDPYVTDDHAAGVKKAFLVSPVIITNQAGGQALTVLQNVTLPANSIICFRSLSVGAGATNTWIHLTFNFTVI